MCTVIHICKTQNDTIRDAAACEKCKVGKTRLFLNQETSFISEEI